MAISDPDDPDRLVIESWIGPIASADESLLSTWITAYGAAEAAALQWLRRRRGQMVATPTDVGSGTDRSSHSRNLKALDELIADLASYMADNVEDLGLTDAGNDLLAAASTGPTETTIMVDTVVGGQRRG
jgi:hypothetical protein